MNSPSILAGLFGLGAPELIVILIILFCIYSALNRPSPGVDRDPDRGLTRQEKRILLALGTIVAIAVGLLIWQRKRR